jgi:hypothetical protein
MTAFFTNLKQKWLPFPDSGVKNVSYLKQNGFPFLTLGQRMAEWLPIFPPQIKWLPNHGSEVKADMMAAYSSYLKQIGCPLFPTMG